MPDPPGLSGLATRLLTLFFVCCDSRRRHPLPTPTPSASRSATGLWLVLWQGPAAGKGAAQPLVCGYVFVWRGRPPSPPRGALPVWHLCGGPLASHHCPSHLLSWASRCRSHTVAADAGGSFLASQAYRATPRPDIRLRPPCLGWCCWVLSLLLLLLLLVSPRRLPVRACLSRPRPFFFFVGRCRPRPPLSPTEDDLRREWAKVVDAATALRRRLPF